MKLLKLLPQLIVALFLLQSCTQHSNWNQYLGPNRNASISGTEILREWPDKGPKKLWSFPLGKGFGGAAIYGKEVFILDRDKGESDIMRCIDLNSGEELWSFSYEAKGEIPYPGSRTVPTVDQTHIWSVGPHGDIYCFDKSDGKPVWNHNLLEEYDRELTTWGVSQAPLLHENLVIVAAQGRSAGVVAYEKYTGELLWKTRALSGHPSHVSPTLAIFGGVNQVIMISPYDRSDSTITHEVVAFDVKSGKELWQYQGLKSFLTITPAVVVDDQRLMLTDCSYDGAYDPVSIMLEITKEGEYFKVKELFLTEEAGSKMHPALQHDNHLYLNHTGNPNQMMCLNMKGEVLWEKGSAPGFELGGLILVDGLIINQNGKNGDIHLIEPSPEGYRELGKASFFSSSNSQAWAPLAFSQGKLIVRDQEKMVCVDLQSPAE